MTILLLGATGRTGHLILSELILKGHTVKIIVRDRTKVQISSHRLFIFEGSTLDEAIMALAMEGCNAIISVLNISRKSDFPWSALRTPKTLISDTIELVITMAKQFAIRRIVVVSAWGASETIDHIPWWFRWTILSSNMKYAYQDHERQEKLLAESGLDWTIIRPVGLVNSNADKPVKVVLDGNGKPSLLISRTCVASFTVHAAEQSTYIKMSPVISWAN